jgi:hypothetical protein
MRKLIASLLSLFVVFSLGTAPMIRAEEAPVAITAESGAAATGNSETTASDSTDAAAADEQTADGQTVAGDLAATDDAQTTTDDQAAADAQSIGDDQADSPTVDDQEKTAAEDQDIANDQTATEAGITPDSWFYDLDRMIEQVQLLLTAGETAKAELLERLAVERLAEAEVMAAADQQALAEQMIAEFTATLQAVTENIEAAALAGSTSADDPALAEVLSSIAALRNGFQQRVSALMAQLDAALEEDPTDAIDETGDTAAAVDQIGQQPDADETDSQSSIQSAIVTVYGLDQDLFAQLSQAGLNSGQAKLAAIVIGRANQNRAEDEQVTVEQVIALQAKGWGNLKKELGLQSGDLGLAIGHILRQAGLSTPVEDQGADDEDEGGAVAVHEQAQLRANLQFGSESGRKRQQPEKNQHQDQVSPQEKARNEHANGVANGHAKKDK